MNIPNCDSRAEGRFYICIAYRRAVERFQIRVSSLSVLKIWGTKTLYPRTNITTHPFVFRNLTEIDAWCGTIS